MNGQDDRQATLLQRPTNNDKEAWKAYWKIQGQPWRTEPEIEEKRQGDLAQRRTIVPDEEKGIYPFRGLKLSRADVEWLLATHENGLGPVNWRDEKQRERQGLDLRGALLSGIDLSDLPLARTIGGMPIKSWLGPTPERKDMAAIHLEDAKISGVHMEGSELGGSHLERADCYGARFERSFLREAHLERTYFNYAYLEQANFRLAHLEGTNFRFAHLQGATLQEAFMAPATILNDAKIASKTDDGIVMVDVRWNDANLAVINWDPLKISGDEHKARYPAEHVEIADFHKDDHSPTELFSRAARAYRQLAIALRNQGVNEEANRFAYRAQLMQRVDFRLQNKIGQYLFSLFFDLIAGYGFKPVRWLYIYLGAIIVFTVLHYIVAMPHLTLLSAITMSILNLHGRPFLNPPPGIEGIMDIVEAFVGLIVEAILIAIITQRILGK